MSELVSTMLGALATWRIAHILLRENGPWHVFKKARQMLGVVYYVEDDGEVSNDIQEVKYEITVCIWCLSTWIGSMVVAAQQGLRPTTQGVLTGFAYSALAVMIDKYFGMGRKP